jgi:hypothetical protein
MTHKLIIDGGNGNIKAALLRDNILIDTLVIPSLLRLTEDCDYVRGGFKLPSVSGVLGWDNENRSNTIVIGDDSQGKLKYLVHIIAGTISALSDKIPVGTMLEVYGLTLQTSNREAFVNAVAAMKGLKIDGVSLKLKPKLINIYPEGFGCGSYAAQKFNDHKSVYVFDIGSGTANLSNYYTANSIPRRQSFTFRPIGVRVFEEYLIESLRVNASNAKVNINLMRHAYQSNTNRMLDTFEGTDISSNVDEAVSQWLNTTDMKGLLNQVIFALQTGNPVATCGGAWKIKSIRKAIETIIYANAPTDSWIVPEDSHLLGVLGIANLFGTQNNETNTNISSEEITSVKAKRSGRKSRAKGTGTTQSDTVTVV